MKVLLKEDVENLGMAGEVHKVSNGYGRNYLLPRELAVVATESAMKQAEVWRQKAEARRQEVRREYEALTEKIQSVRLEFEARAGENGRLYGSITTAQIADALNEKLGTEIDRRKVGTEAIRELGEHKVVVRLSGDFQPELTAVVTNEDGEILQEAVSEVVEEEEETEDEAEAVSA